VPQVLTVSSHAARYERGMVGLGLPRKVGAGKTEATAARESLRRPRRRKQRRAGQRCARDAQRQLAGQ
jgi:hypothetical protein